MKRILIELLLILIVIMIGVAIVAKFDVVDNVFNRIIVISILVLYTHYFISFVLRKLGKEQKKTS